MRLRDARFGKKGFQACRARTVEKIELALRTPEEEEPVDCYRSQPVKCWWTLSTNNSGEAAKPNAERGQPSTSWRRQSANFASFLSACFWQY